MSLAAAINRESDPDALALADERVRLSWRELDGLLNRVINALLAEDLGRERRVGVFALNSAETALAYLGSLHAGVSSTPINFHLTPDEAAYILADSDARLVFVDPRTMKAGLDAAERAPQPVRVVGWRCEPHPGLIAWEDWLAAASPAEPPTDMRPRPHLHYTSGTTGRPKGAETPPTMFPYVGSVAELVERLRVIVAGGVAQGRALAVSPLYHTGPLGLIRALAGGTPLVTMERFDAERLLQTIEREGIVRTLMVPTHFQRLLDLPDDVRSKYDLSSLKWLAHTGAACPRDIKRRMIEWVGPILVEAYGATEAGTTNSITSEEWLRKPGSVGKTQPPFELVVVAEDGARLGPNEVGQLYFRDTSGRGVIYRNDPEKTREVHLESGLFTLGEVGYADEEGYVFITDRVSDMIVSGGVNIYPAEAEQVLIEHPQVADVAVIGAPSVEMGEEVKALVIAADPAAPPGAAELDAFCRARLAGYKCPRSYDLVTDFGRNAMGKVNKRALRKQYWPTDRMIGG